MMTIFEKPIRMCIVCRIRLPQSNLLRLQCTDGKLNLFSGTQRSFYLCSTCLEDSKKLNKMLSKHCKRSDDWSSQLNEIRSN